MMRAFRTILAALLLSVLLLLALLAARRLGGWEGYDPYFIDYDQPGIDITSEGP